MPNEISNIILKSKDLSFHNSVSTANIIELRYNEISSPIEKGKNQKAMMNPM